MGKIVKDSYKIGEEGVLLFNTYCNNHKPFIIFREVTKHDFGIDGELELTKVNEEKKTEATAEILKVQIKTVNSSNSYIKNETKTKFDFYPRPDDLEYWLKHSKFNIPVILIIVDLRNDTIYAKKITDTDIFLSRKAKGQRQPITFDKIKNELVFDTNDFVSRFSSSFTTRVDYQTTETLVTNSLVVKKYPKLIYKYKSKFKSKKEIYQHIESKDAPHFIVKSDYVYTFRDIKSDCTTFCSEILEEVNYSLIGFNHVVKSIDLTNIYLELLYEHFKFDLEHKCLRYSKEYKRFYFRLKDTEESLEVNARTRKRDSETQRKVVTYHEYGKTKFFRHLALDFKAKLFEDNMYLIINPKYYFTKDRREPLSPKQITRYTNYLTSREHNNEYTNSLHFWKTYLFSGNKEWSIYVSDKEKIIVGDYINIVVPFGITIDIKEMKKKEIPGTNKQLTLEM